MERSSSRRWWAGLAATLIVASACNREDTSTQITLVVTSETKVPQELNAVEVTVNRDDGSNSFYYLYPVASVALFPATLAIVPRDEESLRHTYRFEVRGVLQRGDGSMGTVVLRRAVVGFARERNVLLSLPLRMACFAKEDCRSDETCRGGTCVPSAVPVESLPTYDERYVVGSRAPDTCFDDDKCLADGSITPVDERCQFSLPSDLLVDAGLARPRLNLAIEWEAAPERDIVLDYGDELEGWTVDANGTGQLAKGICQLLFAPSGTPNKANHLLLSRHCDAKEVLQPNCRGYTGRSKLSGGAPPTASDASVDGNAEVLGERVDGPLGHAQDTSVADTGDATAESAAMLSIGD